MIPAHSWTGEESTDSGQGRVNATYKTEVAKRTRLDKHLPSVYSFHYIAPRATPCLPGAPVRILPPDSAIDRPDHRPHNTETCVSGRMDTFVLVCLFVSLSLARSSINFISHPSVWCSFFSLTPDVYVCKLPDLSSSCSESTPRPGEITPPREMCLGCCFYRRLHPFHFACIKLCYFIGPTVTR